ncbi:uncharacterized protein [Aristolochia californica]|uniref:uncharacterized protein n=1 Tax=Aristolochia californica TaxID=171875 RepID=UPI0035DD5AA9
MAAFLLAKTRLFHHLVHFLFHESVFQPVSEVHKLLHLARHCISFFLSFLHILLSSLLATLQSPSKPHNPSPSPQDSVAARALYQVFSLVTAVPVSSRKYASIRSLADTLVEENHREGPAAVNRKALSGAFSITLELLEEEMAAGASPFSLPGSLRLSPSWALRIVGLKEDRLSVSSSGEKLAAELLWLARRLGECGGGDDAVSRWGWASGLAHLSQSAEPRLQASILRVCVYLFKQARELEVEERMGRRMKMLTTWLPFLCQANNGIDVPVLSSMEKAEMVKILEEMIEELNRQQQEKVLALWLDNFMSNPDSDWPNLQPCYTRWYTTSRRLPME